MALLQLPQQIETVRIPEMPLFSAYGPITTSDFFVVWLAAFNKTVKVDAQSLYTFFQAAGGGSFPPVVLGDKVIKVVSAIEAGGTTLAIPELAGKNFFLERDGYPMLLTEFNNLNAGGMQLTALATPDVLIEGQRFVFHVFELQGGSSSGSSGQPFIKGEIQVSTNTTFDTVNHVNKLIQIRGGSTKITFTLPLVDDIPDYTIIPVEALITNTVEQKIVTQGGQSIYVNNTAKNSVYMRAGNVMWFYRADDGYYDVTGMISRIYLAIGEIKPAFKIGLNELLCKGQTVNRSDYPRLWEYVQTLGGSFIPDTDWTASTDKQGCFSNGDGSTTFRLPDLMNMFLRGVKSESGTDAERTYNKPGGRQEDQIKEHGHTINTSDSNKSGNDDADPVRGTITGSSNTRGGAGSGKTIGLTGGAETRPVNIGVYWVIKC